MPRPMGAEQTPAFLFSIDVEDAGTSSPGGNTVPSRVPALTGRYLEFLNGHRAKGTFFVVGEVARDHPDLVRRIIAQGHEIGCHSDRHIALDRQGPGEFRDDLRRNLDALRAAGAGDVRGYRAPCFSVTEKTRWVYPILAELGFLYSSSVLPARNPLYGWPGFGSEPRLVDGVMELPVTLLPYRLLPVPMGGGVYFRALPARLHRLAIRATRSKEQDIFGYLHPYDIDEDPGGDHPGFSRFSPYGWLMARNRGGVFTRLEAISRLGFEFRPYGEHAEVMRRRVQPESN